jgi:hypothetical protein
MGVKGVWSVMEKRGRKIICQYSAFTKLFEEK